MFHLQPASSMGPAIGATATEPMQPSQQNQAELPEFRAANAKSKAANFRAVETKLLPFKMGEDGNPSVAARDGYAWVTLPFPQNEILARFPAAAAPSFTARTHLRLPAYF
jgi:hypothetical protein